MDLLQKSARFRNYVALLEDQGVEFDINAIIKKDFDEITGTTGLDARQIDLLINTINLEDTDDLPVEVLRSILEQNGITVPRNTTEAELRKLFMKSDISLINEDNYADVLEMIFRLEFDQKHLIVKELSRRCRMNDYIYDIEKLTYNEETGKGDETLKDLVENHTCICIEDKCPNRRVALERKHYYCLRGTFDRELEWLTENEEREAIVEMIEMGIIKINDIFEANKKYAIKEYPEMAHDYITENPDDIDTIMYFIEVLREEKKDAPQNFKLLKVLVDNGYVLSDNDRKFLFDYGQGNSFYRKEITDLLLYQDAYTAIKKNPGANKQKIQNLIQDLTRGKKDAPQDFKLIQILVDNGYILTENDKKFLNIYAVANKDDAAIYDQINRLLNPPDKK